MITVILVNILAVSLAYQARNKGKAFYLKLAFFVIFLFLSLRYNYGNDYPGYLDGFIRVNLMEASVLSAEHFEPGWVLLCRLFEPWGFFAMVAALAAFNCFSYYRFVYKYVPAAYYWFALFIYTFDAQIMLVHSSAMRQSLAVSVFLFAVDYIYKKDLFRYLLLIAIAMSFHMSAVILIPVYLLGVFNNRIGNKSAGVLLGLFISLFVLIKSVGSNLSFLLGPFMGKYGIYDDAAEVGTGFGFLFYTGVLACILYCCRSWKPQFSLIAKIAMLSYLIMPLGLAVVMIGRLSMYFQPLTLAVYPYLFLTVKSVPARYLLILTIFFATLYMFNGFFKSDVYQAAFGTYQTIFSAPNVY